MASGAQPNATILVAEDDAGTRAWLTFVLQGEGYQVVQAANGQEALDRLRMGPPPDLIVLDMLMPVLDGWHFLAQLKRQAPQPAVPVLIVTATILTPEWAQAQGCSGFIKKPLETDEFLAEVRRCLAARWNDEKGSAHPSRTPGRQ